MITIKSYFYLMHLYRSLTVKLMTRTREMEESGEALTSQCTEPLAREAPVRAARPVMVGVAERLPDICLVLERVVIQ